MLKHLYKHKSEYTLLWSIPLEKDLFSRMVETVHDAILETLLTKMQPTRMPTCMPPFCLDMMALVRWWFSYEGSVSAKKCTGDHA